MLIGGTVLLATAGSTWPQAIELPEIVTTASRVPTRSAPSVERTQSEARPEQSAAPSTAEPIASASELTLAGERVVQWPNARPGEYLEATPGLVVTQHSGEGKANQYFLRGFNLDHGTDLAITVDGMPVNMRTHGHGQGYADISFLIPELIQSMRIRKGPYFADEGDFSAAGAVHIDYVNTLAPGLAQGTAGMFGYGRALAIKSFPAWAGNLLVAGEATRNDGPWEVPDRMRKINGVVRFSQGTALEGFTITGMAYSNRWNATDQVANRAIEQGLIGRFGTLDPTDGGRSSRFSLSSRFSTLNDWGATRVEAYAIRYTMTLFNNFTYFLNDEINGDQFSQTDSRTVLGVHGHHTFTGRLGPFDSETRVGVQGRHDAIAVGLNNTLQRRILSTVRSDNVKESSIALYAQNTTRWTPWLRTVIGGRGDWYAARVVSDNPLNSGSAGDFIASPKLSMIFGPFNRTELFVNAGYGFHSNDARGVTITVDPVTSLPADKVPFLVRAKGAEIGVTTKVVAGLESSLAIFVLDYASELLFVGDAGTTEASRPSRRVGFEWTNHYKPVPWLAFDLDLAMTRSRFVDPDPAGDFIPGSPVMIASAGLVLGRATGWFGAIKLRYFGPRPLIEDNSVRSTPTTMVNARAGYRFQNGMRLQLDALNLFNVKANQIEYYYESRLASEPSGVATFDRHLHPVEPLALRLTLAGPL
ncbi:MAG: TonB-dependent receptor [Hyphomicrobiales bacterium]|nr:TonB-dependent receptor [Hyphomicrobiales bacterium]